MSGGAARFVDKLCCASTGLVAAGAVHRRPRGRRLRRGQQRRRRARLGRPGAPADLAGRTCWTADPLSLPHQGAPLRGRPRGSILHPRYAPFFFTTIVTPKVPTRYSAAPSPRHRACDSSTVNGAVTARAAHSSAAPPNGSAEHRVEDGGVHRLHRRDALGGRPPPEGGHHARREGEHDAGHQAGCDRGHDRPSGDQGHRSLNCFGRRARRTRAPGRRRRSPRTCRRRRGRPCGGCGRDAARR